MRTLMVTYSGSASDRFDKEYFVNKHLPLVRQIAEPLGMLSIEAFVPAGKHTDIFAVGIIVLRDEQAEHDLFSSPRFTELVDDVPNYTNLMPKQSTIPHLTA